MHVVIGIPTRGLVHYRVIERLDEEFRHWPQATISRIFALGENYAEPKNRLAERFLQTPADFFVLIDDDVEMPDGFARWFVATSADVGIAPVVNRIPDVGLNIRRGPSGALEYFATACAMFRRRVFERSPAPWWRPGQAPRYEPDLAGDAYFSHRILTMGFHVVVFERTARHFIPRRLRCQSPVDLDIGAGVCGPHEFDVR